MSSSGLDKDKEKARLEQELRIQRQIAFASGIFQGDITIRTLLESLAEGVVIIDNSGTILLVNSRAEQMFGYSKKELIGKPHAVLIPERFRTVHEGHEAGYFKEPRVRPMGQLLDLAGRRQDGSEFPLEISLGYIETINGVLVMALVSDMTLRKQFESRLRESEELFHIQVEGVKDYAIFMLDARGNVLNWNLGAERLKGYGEKEIIGRHFSCFYSEEERNAGKPEEELKIAAAEGRVEDEGWRIRKDGSRFWADVIITALRDGNGNLRGFSKVTRDISGRKRMEEDLRESEERFRATFNQAAVGIGHVTPDGRWLRINQKYCDIVGYTAEEFSSLTIEKITHPDDLEASMKHYNLLLEGKLGNYSLEKRYIRKDGSIVWVNLTASMVYDARGNPKFAVGIVEDITARKRTEEEREQLLLQLEAVLESINEGVVISDIEGNVLTMNKEALALHEYESVDQKQVRRQLSEYQDTFELFDHEERRLPFEEWPLVRALRGESFVDWEVRIRRRDTGKLRIWNYSGTPVRSKSGDIILSVITVRDISERKFAEEEIERLNTNLAARAAELEAVNREMEAFNYTVAHDLRKPLTVVNGYCQAIREICGHKLDENCTGYLEEAYQGTLRMNRLIEALLNFSRLSHIKPRRELVDLSAMAHESAAELRLVEPGRRVTFVIADRVSADGDAALLRVVLDNLLGNAWKYTGTRDEGIIEFGSAEVDGKNALFVRDNGTGFDMADEGKLFIPFQRLPGAEDWRGFGIGLATVERVVRSHGGRVWAEGEPGKGATFYFTLPQSIE